jgi:hypothetical protein
MIIWFALLIPLLTAIVLFKFFYHRTAIWEFSIPFLASLILIFIIKFSAETAQTSDTEYLSEPASHAIYSEPWDEEVDCRHEIPCSHTKYCTDDKGNEYSCGTLHDNDGFYHLYDVDYHPEYWSLVSVSGRAVSITKTKYNILVDTWGNKIFEDQNRQNVHSIDGDWYVTYWDKNNDQTIECMVYEHYYENRVQASNSVFNYPDVTEAEKKHYDLYDYPIIYEDYKQTNILGLGDSTRRTAERKMEILNAKLGKTKQVKVFMLLFRNKNEEAAFKQECYWKGGNKNELVVCIGIDDALNIKWCKPFSFTESSEIKINIRNFVSDLKKLNSSKVVDFLFKEVNENFKRKRFSDFEYINVEPKEWQIWLTFILTLVINVLVSLWVIKNEITK